MAALNFPDSPTIGDIFTVGTRSWQWNGTTWDGANSNALAAKALTQTLLLMGA